VTEIPEHLLRRSRERRASLGDGEAGGESAPEPAAASSAAAAPSETAPVPAAAAAPARAAAAPAVVDEPLAPVYVAGQAAHRSRIPIWAAPILLILPFWAVLYAGAFGTRGKTGPVDPLVLGQQVYNSAGCSGCHGAAGEGGVGPALHGGQAKLTFPNEADHIKWVQEGSQSKAIGTPYGDPNRAGGQHVVKVAGMPAFSSSLSQAQIEAVVKYEREKL
jgi:mono/diheme cytochrome c family protein